jgi:hypothetical protein
MSTGEPQPSKLKTADLFKYVLYVKNQNDSIIELAKQTGFLSVAHVQVVSLLNEVPEWLQNGLPVVVNTETKEGYRGSAAQKLVSSFVVPVELRHSVASANRRKMLWKNDADRSTETEVSSRVNTYFVRG